MLKKHSDIIRDNLSTLVENTDLTRIIPCLQNKRVLNQETILRILNPAHDVRLQTTNLYTALTKRGPQTFAILRDALQESNHIDLANLLSHMDSQESFHIDRRPSLNSLGSLESSNSVESEERVNYSRATGNVSPELPVEGANLSVDEPQTFTSSTSNNLSDSFSISSSQDSRKNFYCPSASKSKTKSSVQPCNLSEYYKDIAPFISGPDLSPDDVVNIRAGEQTLVRVANATEWKDIGPFHYKMNSYPRGCALVVNNVDFEDEKNFPRRNGAKNDQRRITEMLQQFYFTVEFHENKTRMQMMEIVKKFSQKEELLNVDCALIVFMSHGAEGASEEDTEIIGVDGIGFKTRDIVGYFSNDRCKALINKPKVFFFQACRGVLRDGGVLIAPRFRRLSNRTETDGRKIESTNYPVRIRSISDVFIAYAVPPGRPANRDIFNGTWFIQTIVDVFSENAWQYDLEDMLKMVDNIIKNLDNLEVRNFQAVATSTIGWNKKLYFNPGLRKSKESDVVPVRGVDVVDNCQEGETGTEGETSREGCLSLFKCIVI